MDIGCGTSCAAADNVTLSSAAAAAVVDGAGG